MLCLLLSFLAVVTPLRVYEGVSPTAIAFQLLSQLSDCQKERG